MLLINVDLNIFWLIKNYDIVSKQIKNPGMVKLGIIDTFRSKLLM